MRVASLSKAEAADAQTALASPRYVAATFSKSKKTTQGANAARNKAKMAMSSPAKTATFKAAKPQMHGAKSKKATSSN